MLLFIYADAEILVLLPFYCYFTFHHGMLLADFTLFLNCFSIKRFHRFLLASKSSQDCSLRVSQML